jgi:uncharacterized protein
MKPPLLGNLSPFAKILFVVLLVISSAVIFILAAIFLAIPLFHVNLLTDMNALADTQNPAALPLLKFLQIIQSIGVFIVPPLVAGYLFGRDSWGYSGMKKSASGWGYLLAILIMIASLPFMNWMISMNELLKLPQSLKGLEEWMRDSEDQAGRLTDAFLDVKTFGGFLLNLLMIAIIPAIGEEMLFRGVVQRLFSEWWKNAHVAIFFTAFLFSAIHLQFYGFLPRFALGLFFGYMFWWTGSLWLPILGHFLNNGAAVVISFLVSRGGLNTDYETFGSTDNLFILSGSALLTAFLVTGLYLYGKSRKVETVTPADPH